MTQSLIPLRNQSRCKIWAGDREQLVMDTSTCEAKVQRVKDEVVIDLCHTIPGIMVFPAMKRGAGALWFHACDEGTMTSRTVIDENCKIRVRTANRKGLGIKTREGTTRSMDIKVGGGLYRRGFVHDLTIVKIITETT
jgi:hypothetical protein